MNLWEVVLFSYLKYKIYVKFNKKKEKKKRYTYIQNNTYKYNKFTFD